MASSMPTSGSLDARRDQAGVCCRSRSRGSSAAVAVPWIEPILASRTVSCRDAPCGDPLLQGGDAILKGAPQLVPYNVSGFGDEVLRDVEASGDEESKAKVCRVEIDKLAVAFCPAT
jgi:hypothetical protein